MQSKETSAFKPVVKAQLWFQFMDSMEYANQKTHFANLLALWAIMKYELSNATIAQTRNHMPLGKNVFQVAQMAIYQIVTQPAFVPIAL